MAEELNGKAQEAAGSSSEMEANTVPMPHDRSAAVAAAPASKPAAPEPEEVVPLRFHFTGTGAEYFRIWIVNILLTVVTLGVYSAWAKVRRIQYFYRNTRFDGAVFDYHGEPKAILKGRLLALLLLVAYKIGLEVSIFAATLVAMILAGVLPWLLARSFKFKMANTSYRGVRFKFQGTVRQAYQALILFPIVLILMGLFVWSLVTTYSKNPGIGMFVMLILLMLIVMFGTVPLAHYLLKRYQHDNAYFGQLPFFFYGKAVDFFKIYGKAVVFVILGSIVAGILARMFGSVGKVFLETPIGWLFQFLFGLLGVYVSYLFARPYLESRIQNLVWNNTELGDHKFQSTVGARKLLWIHASNLLLIVVTLGLYKPFAAIRIIKYRLDNIALLPTDKLDEVYSEPQGDDVGATGQEAGEFFDIDIAL